MKDHYANRPHPILLLGDKDIVCFLKEFLQQFEMLVIYAATNPLEAKSLAFKIPFRVLIAETRILGQSDQAVLDCLQIVKTSNPRIRIIISSDNPKEEVRHSWLGIDYCFNKPIQLKALAPKVFEFLEEDYDQFVKRYYIERCPVPRGQVE